MTINKVPPSAVEVESTILGTILIEKGAIEDVSTILTPECFYSDENKTIYECMIAMHSKSKSIDLLTVVQELKKINKLDSVGGALGITRLTNSVSGSANIKEHCQIVYEKFISRETIKNCYETIQSLYKENDVFDSLDEHEARMSKLGIGNISDIKNIGVVTMEAVEQFDRMRESKNGLVGISTGYENLDGITYGLQAPDLIIIAARPSVGKTAIALNIAARTAKLGNPVAFFSLEMSAQQLVDRIVSATGKIKLENIKKGSMNDDEASFFYNVCSDVADLPIYIDDTASLNYLQLRSKARRLVKKQGIKLIIVDYLQLMTAVEKKNRNREQEVSEISRQMKLLAKELNLPIIALSQMSRDIESRGNKEPQLSDLRESGAIEQDADAVAFLYRDDYQQNEGDTDGISNVVLNFKKHRNGSLEKCVFFADLSIQTFFTKHEFDTYENNKKYF